MDGAATVARWAEENLCSSGDHEEDNTSPDARRTIQKATPHCFSRWRRSIPQPRHASPRPHRPQVFPPHAAGRRPRAPVRRHRTDPRRRRGPPARGSPARGHPAAQDQPGRPVRRAADTRRDGWCARGAGRQRGVHRRRHARDGARGHTGVDPDGRQVPLPARRPPRRRQPPLRERARGRRRPRWRVRDAQRRVPAHPPLPARGRLLRAGRKIGPLQPRGLCLHALEHRCAQPQRARRGPGKIRRERPPRRPARHGV